MRYELKQKMQRVASLLKKAEDLDSKSFRVVLNDIEWDTEDDNGKILSPEKLGLPSKYTLVVDAYNKDDAVDTAISKLSDETGWTINDSSPTVTLVIK